jgi:hypothetical protein
VADKAAHMAPNVAMATMISLAAGSPKVVFGPGALAKTAANSR